MKKLRLSVIAAMLIVVGMTICNSIFEISAETHSSVVAAPLEGVLKDNIAGMGWVVECVDCPKHFTSMTDRSLRLDAAGLPHIAYGDDHLYYAWNDGESWQFETVDDEPGVGSYASLALDVDDNAHISYYDDTYNDLKYAYQDDFGWHAQTLDSEGLVGANTALSVDIQGHAHILYTDETNGDLKYAFQDSSGWHTERVGSANTGPHTSLALSATGIPYISYFDDTGDGVDIMYAYRSAGSWTIWSVPTPIVGTGGGFTSIALDEDGYPHISYYTGYDTYDLGYASRDAAGWHFTTVESDGRVGLYTSLALDEDGYPQITYLDWTNNALKVAFQDNSGWHIQTISNGASSASHPSLALDQNGYAHISFLDNVLVKYTYQDTTGWHTEILDSGAEAGLYNSLELDADGYPHISYRHGTELWYAYQDATGFHTQAVDNEADVGLYTSLALNGDGYAHISYYDNTNKDLKYSYHDISGWHNHTVDSVGNVGLDTSLALDAAGYPHISYYDAYPKSDLKYAYQDSSGWHFHTVDSGEAGRESSLVLDSNGYAHISYYDFTESCLKYAYEDESGWHTPQIVDSNNGTGQASSLALDADDYPHISYQDYNDFWDRDLKYAYKDNDGWHILPIVDVAGVRDTSLELDMDGYPRIVYPDGSFNMVIYVYEDDAGWDYQFLESIVDADMVSDGMISLELNEGGYPRISYYNSTNSDLIYAEYVEVPEPIADFTAIPTTGRAPLSVSFSNTSTGYFTSSHWDFGDGQTSTLGNPSHTYIAAGEFTVTLTVSGTGGTDALTRQDYITVYTQGQFSIYLPLALQTH